MPLCQRLRYGQGSAVVVFCNREQSSDQESKKGRKPRWDQRGSERGGIRAGECTFGNPAVVELAPLRPVILRARFSAGLPFRVQQGF